MSLDTNQSTNADKSNVLVFFKRHYILSGLFIFIIAATGWWKYEFPSAIWRYKLTVTVETPEGIKTGSVVREARAERQIKIGDCCGGSVGTAGEALIVDLGKRGILFGLTEELDPVSTFFDGPPAATREGMKYYSHLKNAKADLLKENYKLKFVTFKDTKNPLTVEAADINNLTAIFGQGVHVKDFMLETTNEPLTRGMVNQYLPWLIELRGGLLDGTQFTSSRRLSNFLHGGNFQKGI